MGEAERAALHQEQQAARCQARCDRLEALAGNPAARLELSAAWEPVYLAMLEAGVIEPTDACVCSTAPYDADLLIA